MRGPAIPYYKTNLYGTSKPTEAPEGYVVAHPSAASERTFLRDTKEEGYVFGQWVRRHCPSSFYDGLVAGLEVNK